MAKTTARGSSDEDVANKSRKPAATTDIARVREVVATKAIAKATAANVDIADISNAIGDPKRRARNAKTRGGRPMHPARMRRRLSSCGA